MIEKHPNLVDEADRMARNFHAYINNLIEEGKHIQLLHIRVFEELGLDTQPLWNAREARSLRIKQKKEANAEQMQRQKLEKEQLEAERLEKVKLTFLNNEYINVDDFLILCKQADLDIHIRTKGTFNKNVSAVKITGSIKYHSIRGKKVNLDGCSKTIFKYKELISKTNILTI